MPLLRFNEVIGTAGNDSFPGVSDTIYFGLGGDDQFQASVGADFMVFAGGPGADTYRATNFSVTIVGEYGDSAGDTGVATGIGLTRSTSFAATIDGRHIWAFDTATGQEVIVLDWLQAANRIETIQLAEGTFTVDQIAGQLPSLPNFLGNISWESSGHGEGIYSTADFNEAIDLYRQREQNLLVSGPQPPSPVNGAPGPDFLIGTPAADTVNGFGGDDTLFGLDGSDTINGGDGGDFIVAGTFFEVGSDVVDAGTGNDFVFAGGGSDTLVGGQGNDLLAGELGDDSIDGGPGDNALFGGDGNDTINGGDQGDIVFGELGRDVISTFGGFDLIIGDGNDIGDADSINAGDGPDFVFAGVGNDTIIGEGGPDFMLGENGQDSLSGGDGDDFLPGGFDDDTIDGGAGNDIVLGEFGNDRLVGAAGNDLLAGGPGFDLFVYPNVFPIGLSIGQDLIAGFAPIEDTVQLPSSLGITAAQARASLIQQGADTLLLLGGGNSITFLGIAPAAFGAADFVIV